MSCRREITDLALKAANNTIQRNACGSHAGLQVLDSEKKSKYRKGLNSCKNALRVISLDGTDCSFDREHAFQVNICSNKRDMSKVKV